MYKMKKNDKEKSEDRPKRWIQQVSLKTEHSEDNWFSQQSNQTLDGKLRLFEFRNIIKSNSHIIHPKLS